MESGDWLHALIQALDEKEFRMVKDFAGLGRRKRTQIELLLLDLRKQVDYHPQQLRLKYRNFETVKYQLKPVVLGALRLLDGGESAVQKIEMHLDHERSLYKRGFYPQAAKELEKALELAETHQELGKILGILELKVLRLLESKKKSPTQDVRQTFEKMDWVLNAFQAQIEAFRSYQERFASYRTTSKGEEEEEMGEADEQVDPIPVFFYRDLYQYLGDVIEAHVAENEAQALEAIRKAVDLFDRFPKIKKEKALNYKILLANLGVLLIKSGRFGEAKQFIQVLKEMEAKDFNDEAETFQNIVHLELLLMIDELDFRGQDHLIQRVEEGLEVYKDKINASRKLSILYNLMSLYFIKENYRAVKQMVREIVGNKKECLRKEIQYTTRLLELIVYYELDLWDPPDSMINAAKKYLDRKQQKTKFKIAVLGHLRQLVTRGIQDREGVFQALDQTLTQLRQSGDLEDRLGFALVAAWARSKIEKKPLQDCLRDLYEE